jgi:hypothetical protein
MDGSANTLSAKEIAQQLLADLNLCDMTSAAGEYNLLNLYDHPDFLDIACDRKYTKEDRQKMTDEERDALHDEYHDKYAHDELRAEPYGGDTPQKIKYMKAILEGITEGRITHGDSMLGIMLLDFTTRLYNVADEECRRASLAKNPKEAMPCELAELYKEHFHGMQKKIYQGASQGLFTSGQPLEPNREKSIVEKYASGKGDGAKKL